MGDNKYFGAGGFSDSHSSDVYFAAKEAKETAGVLLAKGQSFFNVLQSNAYLEKLYKSWRAYYGAYNNDLGFGHQIGFTGEQGELVHLPVNHFRNIAQHMYVMVTASRPVMEARAINTDYKSLAQTHLANGILDYYMREKRLEDCLKKACEMAIVLGSGFVKLDWNATAGEGYDVDPDTGEIQYEGDIEFSNLTPLDVVVDGTKESWDYDWVMVRTFKNRFNLAAKYPELSEKIKGLTPKSQSSTYRLSVWSNDDTDDVPVYEFYHKRTEAMPDGRYLLFADTECIFMDTKLVYRDIPVFRIAPNDILGTPYGYTIMYDIFPLQEAVNSTYSAIMTNQNAFAVQNVWVPKGADISFSSIEGAMNIVEGNVKPEPLNLTETPAEVYKFLEILIQTMETISGVNSVARGNPEASLRSGTALALVQSMALQFISGLQQSYVKLIEDTGTSLINILKDFAKTPKVVALVGKNNRPLLKEFTGDQINAISRVIVDVGNPLSKSIAGRVQMAEQMLQMKLLKNPQQYMEVLKTGNLDVSTEGDTNELMNIKSENERLMEGENPIVSPLDKHSMHINEHKDVLSDPDLRKDVNLVKVVMDHIEGHLNALRNTDPALLQLIGEQALPPLPVPGAAPQGAPGPGSPPPGIPMPPQASLAHSPAGPMMAAPQQGPSTMGSLPGVPKPAAPFQHLPVNAADLIPK